MPIEETRESDYIEYAYSKHIPRYYETNKMRYWLKAVNQSEGMPIKLFHYVGFYGGMAFWIPNTYGIFVELTDHWWRTNPQVQFKYIIIWKVSPTFEELQEKQQIDIGGDILDSIPLVGSLLGEFTTITWDVEWTNKVVNSVQKYPVWENLNYKHTAGNQVLQANYTKVIEEILPLIIKKYGE